jgi:hypothetical protein
MTRPAGASSIDEQVVRGAAAKECHPIVTHES